MTTQSEKFRALAETLGKPSEAKFEATVKKVARQPKSKPKKPQPA